MSNYIITNEELYHHGVKGMKWGVRRYQNKDGSLTPSGKKRYSDKSPYEVKTVDGDTFHVSRGSNQNYNSKLSKVTKTWGEHLYEIDNNKIQKKAEKRQFKKDVKQYRHDKRILDADINEYGGLSNVRNRGHEMLDRLRVEKGEEYANQIIK